MSQPLVSATRACPGVDTSAPSITADRRPTTSLRSLALRGSAWTVVGFGGSQALRLAGNLVLTRLLFPESFGMMALVGVFLQGLELFSDVGIGPSIIQNRRGDDPDFLDTAWTIQVFRGMALTCCAAALARPVASLWFKKPDLTALMVVGGATSLIMGFNSTKLFTANRHLAMGRLMAVELATQLIGLATTVVLTALYRSVWSIVIGSLLTTTVKMVLSHVALPGPINRPHWSGGAARDLMSFGRWIFLATAMSFLASQGDRLILGRFLNESALGLYSIAFMMSDVPARLVSALYSKVLFPTFSRVYREDAGQLPELYDLVRRKMDLLILPVVGVFIAGAPEIVGLLFDARYKPAGPMLRVLSCRTAIACTIAPAAYTLLAMGRPSFGTLALALRFLWLAAGIPLAWRVFGVWGVTWASGTAELPSLILFSWVNARNGFLRPATEFRAALLLVGGAAAWLALRQFGLLCIT